MKKDRKSQNCLQLSYARVGCTARLARAHKRSMEKRKGRGNDGSSFEHGEIEAYRDGGGGL